MAIRSPMTRQKNDWEEGKPKCQRQREEPKKNQANLSLGKALSWLTPLHCPTDEHRPALPLAPGQQRLVEAAAQLHSDHQGLLACPMPKKPKYAGLPRATSGLERLQPYLPDTKPITTLSPHTG